MAQKPTHVIVKSRHPRLKHALLVLLVFGLVLEGWILFEYGRSRAGFDAIAARGEQDGLLERIRALEDENKRLSAQNAILAQSEEIDRHAYAEVDRSIASLQDEMLELKQEAAFYRGLVNLADSAKGLQIQSFKLERNADTAVYRYRLVLMQVAAATSAVTGEAEMTVSGVKNGVQVDLSQRDLSGTEKTGMQFRFKHFQQLDGSLALPDGFVPLRVTLRVIPKGDGRPPVQRIYNWSELVS